MANTLKWVNADNNLSHYLYHPGGTAHVFMDKYGGWIWECELHDKKGNIISVDTNDWYGVSNTRDRAKAAAEKYLNENGCR
jgi:hypothetical protein